MIKILAIGNSFSQDATALIDFLSDELYVRNLYYPSCSLGEHCYFAREEKKAYEYQYNGERCFPEKVSLVEALQREKWDYITVQQASGNSGFKDTYYPYIEELISVVKKHSDAEIIFHQTWTYEKKSEHPHFKMYDYEKERMWAMIKKTSEELCREQKLRMIKSGELIYKLSQNEFFDVEKDGISLHRDTFHLSLNYGRLATAALWVKFFTNKLPAYLENVDLPKGCQIIRQELEGF